MVHKLKVWLEYFSALQCGAKTFELRKNDRNFKVGDTLVLQEYDHVHDLFTGNTLEFKVTYVLTEATEFGLMPGYCILGLKKPLRKW